MKDYSILIIKPEVLDQYKKIVNSLQKRNYQIIKEEKRNDWQETAKKIYTEFNRGEINAYLSAYQKNKWSNNFIVVFLKHKNGSTIQRLKNEVGNFKSYQEQKEKTLRAEFGLLKEKNEIYVERIFTYNGFHAVADEKELKSNLTLLKQ